MKNNYYIGTKFATKRISTNKEESFKGIATVIIDISEEGFLNPSLLDDKILSQEEFQEFYTEITTMLIDPSYQQIIINCILDNIDNSWKYKKLDGTWTETKKEALENAKMFADEAFKKICMPISVYYSIKVFESKVDSPSVLLGMIPGTLLKTCESYPDFLEIITECVIARIEEDMAPFIENDKVKLENDMMMLKILLNKYPEYAEALKQTA